MTIAPGDFPAPVRASLEEFDDEEGVKVFYKPPGKSKNSAAVQWCSEMCRPGEGSRANHQP